MFSKLFFELFEHIVGIFKHGKLFPAVVKNFEHTLFVGVILSAKALELSGARFNSIILIGRKFKTVAKIAYTLGRIINQR